MKQFEWDDLRTFLAILRGRSIRAASKLMGVSHSTVSRRLHAMELQLGIKLFVRQPEGLILTEVGEAMVARAERVESEILSLEREVFGRDALLAGPIRISMPPHIAQHLIMPYIAKFSDLYPDIDIEIDATFDVANLNSRNADVAIRFQPKPDDNLVGHRLPDFANRIYATPDYIKENTFSGQDPTARWVGWGSKETLARWRNTSPYAQCKVHHCVSDLSAQLEAVKLQLGFGYLFSFMADKEPGLTKVDQDVAPILVPAWVLTHPDIIATERVKVFVRFLVEAIFDDEELIRG